jgi:hypothetical protein
MKNLFLIPAIVITGYTLPLTSGNGYGKMGLFLNLFFVVLRDS